MDLKKFARSEETSKGKFRAGCPGNRGAEWREEVWGQHSNGRSDRSDLTEVVSDRHQSGFCGPVGGKPRGACAAEGNGEWGMWKYGGGPYGALCRHEGQRKEVVAGELRSQEACFVILYVILMRRNQCMFGFEEYYLRQRQVC